MKPNEILLNKKKATSKLNIKGETFDWLCLIKGIFPFYSRKFCEKKSTTYFSKKNIEILKKDPILEKIKKIENWKKMLSKTINKNFKRKTHSILNVFPFYNFESIIIERFNRFSRALKNLKEIFFFVFFISNESNFQKYNKSKIETDLYSLPKFFFQMSLFTKLKYTFDSIDAFYLEIIISGKNYKFTFPKKKFFKIKKLEKFKITITFSELNLGLFSLINNKLKKINYFVSPKTNTCFSVNSASCKIFSKLKYYILSVKKKKVLIKTIAIIKRKHKIFYKAMKKMDIKNPFLKKKSWIFSKSINFPSLHCYIEGLIFFFEKNLNYLGLYLQNLSFLIKSYQTTYKNDSNSICFFFCKNYSDRSLISIYPKINWTSDSINCRTMLPLQPYSLKNQTITSVNPFFLQFKKKNQRKLIRIKTTTTKIQIRERLFKKKINFLFKNLKKKKYKKIIKKTCDKKLLISTKVCLIFF